MKNVTGTSSAVAIVAVRPGHRADEQAEQRRGEDHPQHVRVEHQRERLAEDGPVMRVGSVQHWQHAPGQRHAQALVEGDVDRPAWRPRATDDSERQRTRERATAERDSITVPVSEEAERVGGQDVEQQAQPTVTANAEQRPRRARPVAERKPRRAARVRTPCTISSSAAQRAARRRRCRGTPPGRSSGPASLGKPRMLQSTSSDSARSSAPKTASLSFMRSRLLGDAHRLHRRAEIGIGLAP